MLEHHLRPVPSSKRVPRSKSPAFRGELFKRNLDVVAKLKSLAQLQGMTVAQLAIAWVLAKPAVDVAIIGARHSEQLSDTCRQWT